jgi:hypothetical protein
MDLFGNLAVLSPRLAELAKKQGIPFFCCRQVSGIRVCFSLFHSRSMLSPRGYRYPGMIATAGFLEREAHLRMSTPPATATTVTGGGQAMRRARQADAKRLAPGAFLRAAAPFTFPRSPAIV